MKLRALLLLTTVSVALVSCNKKSKSKFVPAATPGSSESAEAPQFNTDSATIAGLSGEPAAEGLDNNMVKVSEVDASQIYAILNQNKQDIVVTVPVVYEFKNKRKGTINSEITLSSSKPDFNGRKDGHPGSPSKDVYILSSNNLELQVTVSLNGAVSIKGSIDGEESFEKDLTFVNDITAMSIAIADQKQESINKSFEEIEDKSFMENWVDWETKQTGALRNTPFKTGEKREKAKSDREMFARLKSDISGYFQRLGKAKKDIQTDQSAVQIRKKIAVTNEATKLRYGVIKSDLESHLPMYSAPGEQPNLDAIGFHAAENEVLELSEL